MRRFVRHAALDVLDLRGNDKASHWTEVGAAWPNKDGQGFSLRFTAIPLSGRLVMRTITERPEQAAEPTGDAE